MKRLLSCPIVVTLAVAYFWCNPHVRAEDKKVPEADALPAAPKDFAKEVPKTGLAAAGANPVFVTPRGAFGIPFASGAKGSAAFEWAGKGYDSRQTYLGFQNNFHYWKVDDWQVVVAIRNTATGGKFDTYLFVNGGSNPIFYSQGAPFPAP